MVELCGEALLKGDEMKKQYWYRITIDQAGHEYGYYGTSELSEKELVEKLKTEDYILLDNLVYYDSQQRIKNWSDWFPNIYSRVYINPKQIISIQVLKENPKKTKKKTRK